MCWSGGLCQRAIGLFRWSGQGFVCPGVQPRHPSPLGPGVQPRHPSPLGPGVQPRHPYLSASWESSCLGGSGSVGHFTPLQRCHGGGGLSFVPGVLRENFCGAQGFRRVETGAGSLPPPWIFTVTRELYLHARARGIHLRVYLDDWFVLASSPELCTRHSQQVLHLCRSLGFSLNEEKSDLRPSQWIKFLGMTFNTLWWLLFPAPPPPPPPPPRIQRLQSLLSSLLHRDWATAQKLVSPLGQMESFAPLVPLGRLHKRKFQHLFRDHWSQAHHPHHPRDLHIPFGIWFQESTSQWGKTKSLSQRVPITLPSPLPPAPPE